MPLPQASFFLAGDFRSGDILCFTTLCRFDHHQQFLLAADARLYICGSSSRCVDVAQPRLLINPADPRD